MRKNLFKRILALLFALIMLSGMVTGAAAVGDSTSETVQKEQVSRLINVVYDDSNSMLLDGRLWWCYAKYSLEVFSAMMQDRDMMNIYYMSDADKAPGLANLSGDRTQQQKNISLIHDKVTYTRGTPFVSLKRAYGDLQDKSGYDEKWLMVITDGDSFNDRETSEDIDKLISSCSAYNIKVVYLAIGDALVPTANASKGIYVYKADGQVSSGETGILSNVTQICQRIFQRPALKSSNSSKLVLDIPVSEIIVFAQGSNVSIGDLNGTKKTLSTVAMNSYDKDKATTNQSYVNKINIATLNASIATFTPKNGEYISEGTYDLPINADEYVVYYKPCLDVLLELFDSKGNKVTDKYIPIGSYTFRYWLTYPVGHPKYGEKLSQDLFDVEYTPSCTVDGTERQLKSDSVDLTGGDTTIKVIAEYLNFISSDTSLKYVVEDFTINELGVDLEYLQEEYLLSTLEKDNEGITVKVTKNGEAISASDWEQYKLTYTADGLDLKIVKNSDSTFTVYPQYKDGDRAKTATGDVPFNITVSASNDHRVTDSGTAAAQINIYDDISSVNLGITIDDQQNSCDNKNFPDVDTSRKVTIDWDGRPLTEEQYNALKLAVNIDDDYYTASIELDPYVPGEPTTATVRFDIPRDENGELPLPKKLHGTKDFTVSATIEKDGEISTGEQTGELKVGDGRTFWELLMDWLPILIALAIILFIILGYFPIIKKYLPAKSKYRSDHENTVKWYSNPTAVISILIPFYSIRSKALVRNGMNTVSISVKARGGKRAVITNMTRLRQDGYIVDNNRGTSKTHNANLASCYISKNNRKFAQFIG